MNNLNDILTEFTTTSIFNLFILSEFDIIPKDIIYYIIHIYLHNIYATTEIEGTQHHSTIVMNNKLFICGIIDSNKKYITEMTDINVVSAYYNKNHPMIATVDGTLHNSDHTFGSYYIHGFPTNIACTRKFGKIKKVKSASSRSLVLTEDGLYVCGDYISGTLGISEFIGSDDQFRRINIENIISFDCRGNHSMVLTHDGLFGFGINICGQLGTGNYDTMQIPHKIDFPDVITVACGFNFTMAITKNGSLYACGNNYQGFLGLKEFKSFNVFTKNPNIENVISIKCGDVFTLALTTHGIYTIGPVNDMFYFRTAQYLPVKLNIKNPISFGCGDFHAIVLAMDGFHTFGSKANGKLGQH